MPTYAELMEILKANEIKGYFHYTKSKLIDLLVKRGLISEKYGADKQEKLWRVLILNIIFKGRYSKVQTRLRYMTWKQIRFAVYKAALAFDQNTGVIDIYNQKYGGTGMRSKC